MSTIHPLPPVSMIVTLFAFLCLIPVIRAASDSGVTVFNPLETQFPTIARVNKYWTWSPSRDTFHSDDGDLRYTTSTLPTWMAFDARGFMFVGTPSEDDVGSLDVTVTAHGSSASASSSVTLFVSKNPPPSPRLSVAAQFLAENPSLSSVFPLTIGSSLAASDPTLRIPSKWSFSIGFEFNTYESVNDAVYYAVKQANGSSLPDWMSFNRHEITLNGVTPSEKELVTPTTFHLQLHASDQEGYSAGSMSFGIIIASHELSATNSMPTINITTTSPSNIHLDSPADFSGIFVDDKPIHPQNISDLIIDISGHEDWLQYNRINRSLSGNPRPDLAGQRLTLPVTLITTFNQSINTNVSLALVPSYFNQESLPTEYVAPGDKISLSLTQFFSNSTFESGPRDVNLTMTYEPSDIKPWFKLLDGPQLEGIVPDDCPTIHILVMFTAYSHITHSTSHASLPIFVSAPENDRKAHRGHWAGLTNAQHARMVLALVITLGILGGLCLIGGLLAIVRRCARVEDTALTGEEGRNAWSEKDRKWYGFDGGSPGRFNTKRPGQKTPILGATESGEGFGFGLHRVQERGGDSLGQAGSPSGQSSGMMSKREFFAKLKQTVRYVSNRYSPKRRRTIGSGEGRSTARPVLVRARTVPPEADVLPFEHAVDAYPTNLFREPSNPGSSTLSRSPSTSTAAYSIPQRRGDFGRPKPRTQVHFDEGQQHVRPVSRTSTRSNKSLTIFSQDSPLVGVIADVSPISPTPAVVRPRLVPFTSSTRVPVPSLSPGAIPDSMGSPATHNIFAGGKRITSQKAKIVKIPGSSEDAGSVKKSGSGDELRIGLRYVQALGADNLFGPLISPGVSSNVRSSFSSLESSTAGHNKASGAPTEKRVLVIPGQKFKFLVQVPPVSIAARAQGKVISTPPPIIPREYNVKIISGQPLSQLHVDLNGIETRGTAEVAGECTKEDLGIVTFGIYAGRNDEICLAMIIIEVAEAR
ncbi:hypothetical protein P691DRAFT_755404 [Macrolepiota fuliginosa MF-IS2]|uniref:Dystroglycan-type cadherin-like domain-containing protein n=1 Tax=Macrolepiota fuliginosa MF-IS2 TaxID=1400762 RepID=A0A9P5XNB0_9AGAR|nr:hypothetical protein P691DRAFT_755404 [Macrolepiota fuliginosa MF-IS2]